MLAGKRGLALAVIGYVVAGAVTLFSASQVWFVAQASSPNMPMISVELSGRAVYPLIAGAGVLLLAAAVGIIALRGWWRSLVAIVVSVVCILALGDVITVANGGTPTEAAATELGVSATRIEVSTWWLVALCGLVIGLASCLLAAIWGPKWHKLGSQYERQTTPTGAPITSSAGIWDALDRGEDPTADDDLPQ